MSESDRIRLRHMLDAAREALAFGSGKTAAGVPPLVAQLERILSREVQSRLPE